MKTLSRQLTASALAVAGTVAALSFGGVAQAAIIEGTVGELFGPLSPTPSTGPSTPISPEGQTFTNETSTGVSQTKGTAFTGIPISAAKSFKPLTLTRIGNGPTYSYSAVTDFFSIASNFGPLLVSIPAGTVTRSGNGAPIFSGGNIPAIFKVAGGTVTGTLTDYTFGRLAGNSAYQFGIILPPAVVPEPSAALGLLGVAGVGLMSRRRKA